MEQESLTTLAALALLASQITSIVRFIAGSEPMRAVNAVIPWAAALGALGLGASADATSALVLPGFSTALGNMDAASLVYAAIMIGSTGGFAHKFVTAIDQHQTVAEPALGAGPDASSNARTG